MPARFRAGGVPNDAWRRGRAVLCIGLLCLLAACGGRSHVRTAHYRGHYRQADYNAPGPADNPWGPYVSEASARFGVPEQWILAVMHQESGGHAFLHGRPITSDAGAMGLMQVMPGTYAILRDRYGLGPDPYDPHDNIMAGTAYIKEMADQYGAPGFLAAYNAGPGRLDEYLQGGRSLPNETINYVASIAPHLGTQVAMSGPLAAYADSGEGDTAVASTYSAPPAATATTGSVEVAEDAPATTAALPPAGALGSCDPNAAYDPAHPCIPSAAASPGTEMAAAQAPAAAPIAASAIAAQAAVAPGSADCVQDPNAAYDPDSPCRPAPPTFVPPAPPPAVIAYAPPPPPSPPVYAMRPRIGASAWTAPASAYRAPAYRAPAYRAPVLALVPRRAEGAGGAWGIQVGAYAQPGQARHAAEGARTLAPGLLTGTRTVVGTTNSLGGQVLYRARLVGLSASAASSACSRLARERLRCITVPPGG